MILQRYRIIGTSITFDSLDDAEAYARKNGIEIQLEKIWTVNDG